MTDLSVMDRSLKSAGHLVIFKTLSQPVTFLATVLLVRALSEENYGIYQLFQSVLSLMGIVFSLGLANTLQRFIPEYLAKKQFRLAWDLYRAASLIRLLINIFLLGICLLFWEWFSPRFGLENYRELFMVFSVFILLFMQSQLLELCLYGYFLHKQVQLIAMLLSTVKACGYGLVIFMHWDLLHLILIDVAGQLVTFVLLRLTVANKIPLPDQNDPLGMNRPERQRLIKYAKYYNFNDMGSGILGNQFDNFFVAAFLDPVTVGAYAFCNRLAEDIDKFTPTRYFREVIKPAFFSLSTSTKPARIRMIYQSLAKLNYFFNVPVIAFLACAGDSFIEVIYAGRFINFLPVLIGILAFQTVMGFFKSVDTIAQLRERADIILFSKLFALPNIAGNLLLLPLIGVWGPLLSTGFSQLGRVMFIWYFVRESISFRGMAATFAKTCLYWGTIALITYTLGQCVDSPLLRLSMAIALFAGAAIIFARMQLFNRFEKILLRDFIHRKPKFGRMFRRLGVCLT